MNASTPAVLAVVDDDSSSLESLSDLLSSAGYAVRPYGCAQDLLDDPSLDAIDCLISDVRMPGIDGWRLRSLALSRRPDLPVILVTAMGPDAPLPVQVRNYSVEVIQKPFDERVLLSSIEIALTKHSH